MQLVVHHRGADFFDVDYHIFPIFDGEPDKIGHWLVGITKLGRKDGALMLNVHLIDSVPGQSRKNRAFQVIRNFYLEKYRFMHDGAELPPQSIRQRSRTYLSQSNGYDCGPFVMYHMWRFFTFEGFRSSLSPIPDPTDVGMYMRQKFNESMGISDVPSDSEEVE